jgi:PAS domain S-box-containing protein
VDIQTKAQYAIELASLRARVADLEAAHASAQTSLHEAQQRVRTLIDCAPEAILLLDVATGRFIDVNPQAERLFGHPREKLLELGPVELSPPSQSAEGTRGFVQAMNAEAIRGGTPVFEWWAMNARGERFPCEVHLVRMPWGERDVIRGSISSLGTRKHLELVERGRIEVLERVARGAPLDDALHALVRTTQDLLPGMICSVLVLDRNCNCLRLGAAPDLPESYNSAVDGLTIGPSIGSCGAAAFSGRRVIVRDVMSHPNWVEFRKVAETARLRACWSEPVISLAGVVLGTFAMYYREPREPGPVECRAIEIAAQLAAIAIEHEQTQRMLREMNETLEQRVAVQTRELTEANRKLTAADEFVRLAAVAFETHDSLVITDRDGKILRVNEGFTRLTGYTPEEAVGQTLHILKSGRHGPEFYRQMWTAIREEGYWDGEIWNRRKDNHIYPQRLTITCVKNRSGETTHFIGHGQDITENKRAEADRAAIKAAHRVQQALFPSQVPRAPGFEFAGATHPAERVSGDYFDFVLLRQKSIGFLVADVSGHGLGPALVMSQTQAYLRAISEIHDDPGEILTHVNRLVASSQCQHFVTLFLGRIDVDTRTFVYAGAGHHGYVITANDTVRVLESTSCPLGVSDDLTVPSASSIILEPGDIIVLPTDGIEEAESSQGMLFGRERALDVVRTNRQKSAAEIVHALYCAARDFTEGEPQNDDISAIVVKLQRNAEADSGR